ncbi:MAG TPA: YbaK/EbsC family protein [Candidatus Saccharimonadales bacterium]|nr:YbaK/EbsC family protein [Candidatus Saccharimonadales bacterium]
MTEQTVLNYSESLKNLGIEHVSFEHPHLVKPEEVQSYLGETVADCVASLVMKADKRFIVILKKGEDQINFKKIKKALKVGNLRFATKEEFEEVTHLPFGAARVYIPSFETYIEPRVFDKEYLNGGTGSFTCTFKYKTEDLKKIPNSVTLEASDST